MGYKSSTPVLVALVSTDIYVPTGTTANTAIVTTLHYTYTINGLQIVADNFVRTGLNVLLSGTNLPTLAVSNTALSFALTQLPSIALIGTSNPISVTIHD